MAATSLPVCDSVTARQLIAAPLATRRASGRCASLPSVQKKSACSMATAYMLASAADTRPSSWWTRLAL